MKRIKFLANTMDKYKGLDGNGKVLSMTKGDSASVSDEVAALLRQHYGHDFEITVEANPDHAPKSDKALKKTVQFKSK